MSRFLMAITVHAMAEDEDLADDFGAVAGDADDFFMAALFC